MKVLASCLTALLLTLPFAHLAVAHFHLIEPASWLVEAANGDPQKAAPCGGTSQNPGMPSNAIGKITGGTKLHLKVQETVFHPGYYRVALAVNSRAELPKDPDVVTTQGARGPQSVAPRSCIRYVHRSWRTVCFSIRNGRPRCSGKRISTFPTSAVRNALCKSFSLWRHTG